MSMAEANLITDLISIFSVAAFIGTITISLVSGAALETAFVRGAMAFVVIGALGWLVLKVLASTTPETEGTDAQEEA